MEQFCKMLNEFFHTKTRDVSQHARHYLAGLFSHCARTFCEVSGFHS